VCDFALRSESRVAYMTVAVVEKSADGERPVPRAVVTTLSPGGGRDGPKPTDEFGRARIVRRPNSLLFVRSDGGLLSGQFRLPEAPVAKNAASAEEIVRVVVSPAARISGWVLDTDGRVQAKCRLVVRLNFDSGSAGSYSIDEVARTDEQGQFHYGGIPAGTRGEVSAFHEWEGRRTGAKTVVPFKVDEPEPVAVPDVVIPAPRPERPSTRLGAGPISPRGRG